MTEQQTVADPADGQATPAPEADGAPEKSVDDLLREFDTKPEPTPDPTPDKEGRLDKVLDYVERKATEEVNQQATRDIENAVKAAVGDSDLDPEYVEGKLHHRANTDPAFRNAWMSRHERPDQFKQVVRAIGKELAGKMKSSIDRSVSDDRAAVAAAVRSHATQPADAPPSTKDIRKMSDADFEKMKRDMSGR